MTTDDEKSLGDDATFAGQAKLRQASEMSLGDERTLGGDYGAGLDTAIGDIEIVDLEARYKIEGELGKGGMGAVLLATDLRLERKVAIKRILGEAAGNRVAVQRFLTEAKAIAALNHPNIVQIYDYGRAKDGPFLTMEYVDGGSLLDRCKAGALPLDEAVELACQICDGLAKAHDAGIVHRDIKPANVLLTRDGHPKLTDFGLAKAESGDHGQTMTGAVLGTPDFMPPEQRRDAAEVDHRSDLWSLAATVYQMVTGRSPKIIRFKDVPESLQHVLGKALEDEKDSRYQSAKELRDAIRSSQRDAGVANASVGEGQCPGCGTKNDSSRRFCRNCGGSLEATCLSCSKPMPMWEEICGQCGSKQQPLVEERRAAMAARQSEAESSVADFDFDRAFRIATSLKDEPDPRLRQLTGWAERFLPEIDKKRQEQLDLAARSLSEATRHEKAFDYSSGIHALELVPQVLRDSPLPGQQETVAATLKRLSAKQMECRRLDGLIKARIASRELAGLLPEVEKLLVLRPDRRDVHKLKAQLEERQQKLVRQRDEALVNARKAMEAHEYQAAAATLAAVDASVVTPDIRTLAASLKATADKVQELIASIRRAVVEKRYNGLMDQVEHLLQLTPQDQEAQKLRQSLLVREEKVAADVATIESQADAAWEACQFAQAAKLIERIAEPRRSERMSRLQDACADMSMAQSMAVNALTSLTTDSEIAAYDAAIGQASHYQSLLEQWSLTDKKLEEALPRYLQARALLVASQEKEEQQQQRARVVMLSAAAGVVAFVAAAGVVWARSVQRASQVAAAIAQSRWDDALAIEPRNATALIGRAVGNLQGDVDAVAAAFKDLDAVDDRSSLMPELSAARAQAIAARAREYAKQDRLAEAEKDYAEAKRLAAAPASLKMASDAIAAAWLGRADRAVSEANVSGLRRAIDSAAAAGAPAKALAPLRARRLVIEAMAFQAQGDLDAAVSAMVKALLLDPSYVQMALEQPANSMIREGVLAEYRSRFDAATARKDWAQSLQIAAAAQAIDTASGAWVSEAVTGLTPAALAGLPPAVLATLPTATLATLPGPVLVAIPPIRNSIGIELKLIPAGRFVMGDADMSNATPHDVTLTRPFYMGVHEVTNGQWKRVMGSVPSRLKDDGLPVEQVSWGDAVEFCRKLSALPGERTTRREYRLPTEAEWEYACRAGTTTRYSFGDDESQLGEYGWFLGNSGLQAQPVGTKKPNLWGLYDTHGNVWEWCSDGYGEYETAVVADPRGPSNASFRIVRGGCWDLPARDCRTALRVSDDPSWRSGLGFRLAMSIGSKDDPIATASPGD